MKAEWTDNTDERSCLCCQQPVTRGRPVVSAEHAAAELAMLEQLGFTRESLLTKHRAQIDFQMPGLSSWLEAQ